MKLFIQALYHLMFFKHYTTMPRNWEIAYGVLAWAQIAVIVWGIMNNW